MQSRGLKQFIYGMFYVAIIVGVSWLGFRAATGGGSCFDGRKNGRETQVDCDGGCVPCELKNLKPIEAEKITVFDLGGGRKSGLIEFKNPNVRYGADPFTYAIVFMSSEGSSLATTTQQSFIYPGEVKFVVIPDIGGPAGFIRMKVVTSMPFWKDGEVFSRPQVVSRDIDIEVRSADREVVVSGFASNESSFELGEVIVNIAITGPTGTPVAAARTLIEGLEAQGERFFKIVVPAISLENVSRESVRISFEATRG